MAARPASEASQRFLLSGRVERNLTPKTIKAYGSDLRDLAAAFPRRPLERLTPEDLRAYLTTLHERGLKETTIRRRLATLKVFYRWLHEDGAIPEPPTRGIRRRYATTARIPRVIPPSHIETLLRHAHAAAREPAPPLRAARHARDLAMIELLFSTGIRSEEVVRLDLRDLDLERRTLHVSGKGKRERQMYLSSDEVLATLHAHLDHRDRFHPKDNALFLNRFGARLGVQSVATAFRRLLRLAHIDGHYTPHMLRHTMATLLIENGADVRSAQEILGHSNIRTTEIYLEVSRLRKQQVLMHYNARNKMIVEAGATN